MEIDFYNIPKKYNKPHKFFERYLDNDLDSLSKYLEEKYEEIKGLKVPGVRALNANGPEYWVESGSLSTVKWKEYNVFQFNNEAIYSIFVNIRDAVKEACNYYEIDFDAQKYMVQGWFNINYNKVGKLNWHDHGGPWAPSFHGYYCIKAQPSSTFYRIDNKDSGLVENINIDNRLIVSEMGHPHAQGDWDWDGPRITLAYDIVPLKDLMEMNAADQHWLPL